MASTIDATKPVAGTPTTQSVRDQFATAASEITALQTATTAGHHPGTATNDNALAGQVGEFISALVTVGVAMATGVAVNIATVNLTAGDWDLSGEFWFTGTAATDVLAAISIVSGVLPTAPALNTSYARISTSVADEGVTVMALAPCRLSLAGLQSMFLAAQQFGATGATGTGKLCARRAR